MSPVRSLLLLLTLTTEAMMLLTPTTPSPASVATTTAAAVDGSYTTTSEGETACLPPVPQNALPWRANRTWEVVLSSAGVVCSGGELCPNGTSNTNNNNTIPQLRPINAQTNDVITFLVDSDRLTSGNDTMTVTLYQVSEAEFLSCDSSHARAISEGFSSYTIYAEDFFQIGGNYIIGETNVDSFHCQSGLRINITVRHYSCSKKKEGLPCGGRGLCMANLNESQYACECCDGFMGHYCEERDGCYENPCRNGGFCIDIAEGHEGDMFQCLCPYGYYGRNCEKITHVCDSNPCRNNGTCIRNGTTFYCKCPPGFSGANCEVNLDECLSSPCLNGVCIDKEDGYQCYCQPGYGGPNCEFEYNECDSSPCINGGACEDLVGGYTCTCGNGYTGSRCHIKVDLCSENPCPAERRCIDKGNNYTCECKRGFKGPQCNVRFNACDLNPCGPGGTCWSRLDTYFCECKPGFTGAQCQGIDFGQFHVETIPTMSHEEQMDLAIPVTVHMDHLHNYYIAAGTLACAFLIVVIVVTACHCRVHRTYQRFTFKLPSSCSDVTECKRYRDYEDQSTDNHVKFSMEIEGGGHGKASLDALYESSGVEFSDSIEAPLINSSANKPIKT